MNTTSSSIQSVQELLSSSFPRSVELTLSNLAVRPLDAPLSKGPSVLHAAEALAKGLVHIEELPSPSVPTLRVENRSRVPVFFPSGAVLKGGAQTRIVSNPTLVLPEKRVKIAVRCVEAGRWNTRGKRDFEDISSSPLSVKMAKHRRDSHARLHRRDRAADQEETWSDVSTFLHSKGVRSSSQSLSHGVEHEQESTRIAARNLRQEDRKQTQDALKDAKGIAVFRASGTPSSIELFGTEDTAGQGVKMALESVEIETGSFGTAKASSSAQATKKIEEFQDQLSAASWSERLEDVGTLVDFQTPQGARGTAFVFENTVLQVSITFP